MANVFPSSNQVQQESIQFNQPVSESSIGSIAALANELRQIMLPVGSVIYSVLPEATFQTQNDSISTRWILADGRDVTGSLYQTVTGGTTVPDLRGIFIRGRNYGRSGATGNPDGDLAIGTYTADKFLSHTHTANVTDPGHLHTIPIDSGNPSGSPSNMLQTTYVSLTEVVQNFPTTVSATGVTVGIVASGGNETAPRNVTLNAFIRIN